MANLQRYEAYTHGVGSILKWRPDLFQPLVLELVLLHSTSTDVVVEQRIEDLIEVAVGVIVGLVLARPQVSVLELPLELELDTRLLCIRRVNTT